MKVAPINPPTQGVSDWSIDLTIDILRQSMTENDPKILLRIIEHYINCRKPFYTMNPNSAGKIALDHAEQLLAKLKNALGKAGVETA